MPGAAAGDLGSEGAVHVSGDHSVCVGGLGKVAEGNGTEHIWKTRKVGLTSLGPVVFWELCKRKAAKTMRKQGHAGRATSGDVTP